MPGVTNPAEAFFKDGSWSWDGTKWRKQPMLFGFSDTLADRQFIADTGAGDIDLTSSAVPAGEIWVVTNVAYRNRDNACTDIVVWPATDNKTPPIIANYAPTAGQWDCQVINIVMEEGDTMVFRFNGCVALDYIEMQMVGYSMSIVE